MIISSEIEKVEKVEILIKAADKDEKSILRAFARTRAKNDFNPNNSYSQLIPVEDFCQPN
jgi:hypothetical protein